MGMSVAVVGSGASGVHFALSALRKGHQVTMLDVGRRGPEPVNPADGFDALKSKLIDPAAYFLGEGFDSAILPGRKGEYYGFPPSKEFVFADDAQGGIDPRGFAPLLSFGRGGLAEAWTGGAYPFNDYEMVGYPLSYADLRPHYAEVAARIGINGAADDLARFFPQPRELNEPLRLDEHSAKLVDRYQARKGYFNNRLGCYLGRSRLAVLSHSVNGRAGCEYCGRCLWGCPVGALYTPSITLRECLTHPNFRYLHGTRVSHFEFDRGDVTAVAGEAVETAEPVRVPVDRLVLAAGTLMSSKIFLTSIAQATGRAPRLTGLMDNRQVMNAFVNLRMLGRSHNPDSYQYHQLAMGFEGEHPAEYIHCQITTLKSALIHPLVHRTPFDLSTALFFFRRLHAALGLVNVNLHDTRREGNWVGLEPGAGSRPKLEIHYQPPPDESRRLRSARAKVRRALWALGCVVPPGMTHVRPMGASVHYAGTIPMSETPRPLTAAPDCRSHDFDNLYFVDGTTFPFLPAKNLTYTLMANAVRVAELAF